MRCLVIVLMVVAQSALSDTIVVRSAPQSVLVYPESAIVSRSFSVDLPLGTHEVLLPDLPPSVMFQLLPGIEVEGAILGPVATRDRALRPQEGLEDPAITAARDRVKTQRNALLALDDQEAQLRVSADAAEAQLDFLMSVAENEGLTADAASLEDILALVSAHKRTAQKEALAADQAIRNLSDMRETLEEQLKAAEETLAFLLTGHEGRSEVLLTLTTEQATTVDVSLSYVVFAATWAPFYVAEIYTDDPEQMVIERGAIIYQESGEDWDNVALSVSTISPQGATGPAELRPQRLRITDPPQPRAALTQDAASLEEPIVEAPVIVEETASMAAQFDGPGVTYVFASPVRIDNGADEVRVALDTLNFEVDVFARAVPIRDDTAFLMAAFTNTSREPFLPAHNVVLMRDGGFVGAGVMPEIPAGDEGVLAFGRLDGVRLQRDRLEREDGDSGLITRTNTRVEEVRLNVRNLSDRHWTVELLDQVPYSEQEDLIVSFDTSEPPSEENLDFQPGILQWKFDLPAGAEKTITVGQEIRWPEDKILR